MKIYKSCNDYHRDALDNTLGNLAHEYMSCQKEKYK